MSSGAAPRPARTVYLLKRAETAVRNGMEARLKSLSVTTAQYVTLSLLRDRHDQSSAELARRAGITPQSIAETVGSLIHKGLIERMENPDHRRILMTRLTPAGEALLEACDVLMDALESELLGAVPAEDLGILRRALRAITDGGAGAASRPSPEPKAASAD